MRENGVTPGELCGGDPLARSLARLRPTASGIDTAKLLYEVGRAETSRRLLRWQLASGTLALALGLVLTLAYVSRESAKPEIPTIAVKSRPDKVSQPPAIEVAPMPRLHEVSPTVTPGNFTRLPVENEISARDRGEWLKRRAAILSSLSDPGRSFDSFDDRNPFAQPKDVYAVPESKKP